MHWKRVLLIFKPRGNRQVNHDPPTASKFANRSRLIRGRALKIEHPVTFSSVMKRFLLQWKILKINSCAAHRNNPRENPPAPPPRPSTARTEPKAPPRRHTAACTTVGAAPRLSPRCPRAARRAARPRNGEVGGILGIRERHQSHARRPKPLSLFLLGHTPPSPLHADAGFFSAPSSLPPSEIWKEAATVESEEGERLFNGSPETTVTIQLGRRGGDD
jgi:hypothetical protein